MSAAQKHTFSRPLTGLQFKGNRNYLHGSDILPACLQVLEKEYPGHDISGIDIAFHQLSKTALTISTSLVAEPDANVQLTCNIGGLKEKFVLLEDQRKIVNRVEYREDAIVAATKIDVDMGTATSAQDIPFTNIERWIAMTKTLHGALYPKAAGRWYFVRGKFKHYQDNYDDVVRHQVVVQANFNDKLTRSALLISGQRLGDIFFSLE